MLQMKKGSEELSDLLSRSYTQQGVRQDFGPGLSNFKTIVLSAIIGLTHQVKYKAK